MCPRIWPNVNTSEIMPAHAVRPESRSSARVIDGKWHKTPSLTVSKRSKTVRFNVSRMHGRRKTKPERSKPRPGSFWSGFEYEIFGCPWWESNPHCRRFELRSSAGWDTGTVAGA